MVGGGPASVCQHVCVRQVPVSQRLPSTGGTPQPRPGAGIALPGLYPAGLPFQEGM